MITSTTNEFESILRKKDWMELLENQQGKNKLVELWGDNLPLTGKNWIEMIKETRKLYHRKDNEELGSIISTKISNIP